MPRKTIELLLTTTIENLGIVGDIVHVKPGYARNYLLPLGFAEAPSQKRIEDLQEERQRVQAELAEIRRQREATIEKLDERTITLVRSTNDQGLLYGSVTQRDIADALEAEGFEIGPRFIRLGQAIKRVGEYHVALQFSRDLRTELTVNVESDRELEEDEEAQSQTPAEGEAEGEAAPEGEADEAAAPESEEASTA